MSSHEALTLVAKLRLSGVAFLFFIWAAIFACGQNDLCPKDEYGVPTTAGFAMSGGRGNLDLSVWYCAITKRRGEELGDQLTSENVWPKALALVPIFLTKSDITIGDLFVPAGKYSLYFLPSQNGWKLIVSKQTDEAEYDETKDLGRVVMTTAPVPEMPADKLSIKILATPGKRCNGRCDPNNGPYAPANEHGQPLIHFVWGTTDAYVIVGRAKNPENALLR
jgi:hypothetical protein